MNFSYSHLFWNPSRVAYTIPWIDKEIYWYSIFFALGLFIGYRGLFWALVVNRDETEKHQLFLWTEKLAFRIILGIIIGARLFHVLFYDFGYYLDNPTEILMLWNGGLASHGGALGAFLSAYFFWKREKCKGISLSWNELVDAIAFGACWTATAIRIGNFYNQEIIGTQTSSPFGIIFGCPMDLIENASLPHHPVQLYEALVSAIIGSILFFIIYRNKRKDRFAPGQLAGLTICTLFIARFILETIKTPQSSFDNSFLSMGQMLTIPFLFYGFFLLFAPYQNRE